MDSNYYYTDAVEPTVSPRKGRTKVARRKGGKKGYYKSGTKASKASKASKAKGSKKKRRVESYGSYIYKVLKQVHPGTGISKRGVNIMNSFISDIFDHVSNEAGRLTRYSKKSTLGARELQMAVRLTLPKELAKHAESEGMKAVSKFTGSSTGKKGHSVSRTKRAGLKFPVGRIHRFLKKGSYAPRIGSTAAVFLTATLEYLTAEILELAGNAAKDNKKTRISPRYLVLAIRNDNELHPLIQATIAGGGVISHVHTAILGKGKGKKGTSAYAPSHKRRKSKTGRMKKRGTKKSVKRTPPPASDSQGYYDSSFGSFF